MQHLINKVVVFTSEIEEMEAYAEKNMRARIVRIEEKDTDHFDIHEHLYKITFDYTEYDDFNRLLESANYYDDHGRACLTAREANQYQMQETIYFGSPVKWPFEKYFTVTREHQQRLYKKFQSSGASDYVEWLEEQLATP